MAKKITQDETFDFDVEEVKHEEGPVTCLGMTFANDDERRQYFRDELRKKLPELRNIEGFPIGEDEDIIALSDPPYYTACPNPWLNDFIAEWEEEKKQLVADGKRVKDKEVKEPYASDVSEGKNNPIYGAHAYHTKCPHPAIMRYILHYTEPGDIVFDGFAGTGMTGVAANLCSSKGDVEVLREKNVKVGARHGICSDLAPIASLISANYLLPFNSNLFKQKALAVLQKVEKECGWMYEIKTQGSEGKITSVVWSDVYICPTCGKEIVLWDVAINEKEKEIYDNFSCPHCGTNHTKKSLERMWESTYDSVLRKSIKISKKVPVKIHYTIGNKRFERVPNTDDIDLLKKIDSIELSGYHTYGLPNGYNTAQPIRSNGITHIHQFYTLRAYITFSHLYEYVKNDVHLLAWFTSSLQSTSKMNRFRFSGTGINAGTLYIPSLNWEFNPFLTLRRKIESFVESNYNGRGNSLAGVMSATCLKNISNNSVDYMFVDPPFGANIMYSELSSLWEGWLKVITNDKEEAIVNEVQGKNLFDYQRLMNASLKEFYRVLKPGKWLTMEFSNTSASVWNSIQNALQGVGFVVVNVAALDKKQGSFKAVTTTTAVKQDLVITCYKPADQLTLRFEENQFAEGNAWAFIEDYLQHLPIAIIHENKSTAVVERNPKILFDRLISYYVQHGYAIPMNAQEFQKGLKERFVERDGMFFTAEQAIEYEEKRAKSDGVVAMGILVSSEAEGIQWLKNHLRDSAKTYQQLYTDWIQDQVAAKKGDQIPELRDILEENFIKDENGAWHIPNPEKEADLEQLRNKRLQREFDLYVEQASKPKAKIKEARLEALRYGFKECYRNKDFQSIVTVAARIPESLLMEDEILLQYYDIAASRVK